MRFLLMISADEESAAEAMAAGEFRSFPDWLRDLEERGVLRVHAGLHPSADATTVRVRDERVLLTDGPLIEGRDQVGGLAVIECRDLDEAVAVAAAHPAGRIGRIEIRPVREP